MPCLKAILDHYFFKDIWWCISLLCKWILAKMHHNFRNYRQKNRKIVDDYYHWWLYYSCQNWKGSLKRLHPVTLIIGRKKPKRHNIIPHRIKIYKLRLGNCLPKKELYFHLHIIIQLFQEAVQIMSIYWLQERYTKTSVKFESSPYVVIITDIVKWRPGYLM